MLNKGDPHISMAILGKFEAQVFVNDVRVEEFDDDDEDDSATNDEVTKYIEAVSGACFEIKILIDPSYHYTEEEAITARVFIDGEYGTGRVKQRADFFVDTIHRRSAELKLDGEHSLDARGANTFYKFQFAELETREMGETDDTSKFKEKYGELGTIRITVQREGLDGEMRHTARTKEMAPVPEKALKGRPLDVATRFVNAVSTMYDR